MVVNYKNPDLRDLSSSGLRALVKAVYKDADLHSKALDIVRKLPMKALMDHHWMDSHWDDLWSFLQYQFNNRQFQELVKHLSHWVILTQPTAFIKKTEGKGK